MGVFDHFPYTNIHELNLSWILRLMRELDANVDRLNEWKQTHEQEYEQLKEFMDAIISGNFPDSMIAALNEWMDGNALDIVGELIKFIIINITDDGYMVMYIPESWSDIIFNTTGLDIIIPGVEDGRLVLSYDVVA